MGSNFCRDWLKNWCESVLKTGAGLNGLGVRLRIFYAFILVFYVLACTSRTTGSVGAGIPTGARGGASGGAPAVANLQLAHPRPYAESAGATFVGIEACLACHTEAAAVWRASAHAHARDTLRAASAGSSPDCLPCHVTGMGELSGWAGAKTPALEHVTCEACHGPGSGHLDAMVAGSSEPTGSQSSIAGGPGGQIPFRYGQLTLSAAACSGCHTAPNSPDFRFAEYWAKVQHK